MTTRVCMLVRNDCRTDYRVLKEARTLAQADYSVTVVAVNTYGLLEREKRDGFEIVRVPVEKAKTRFGKGINLFPRAIWRMAEAARQTSADVYHAHDSDAILTAWLAARRVYGAKLLYDAHEVGFLSFAGFLRTYPMFAALLLWLWSRLNDWIVSRQVDTVIAVNDVLADIQAEHYRIPRPAVVMNCPPSTLSSSSPHLLSERIGVESDMPIVLSQGMFSLARGDGPGLENLIRSALLLHRGVVVLIGNVGDVPQFEPMRQLANRAEFAGKVFILPTVSPTELLMLTRGASVGVISLQLRSVFRYALPNKFFEYLGAGLPVVTSDIPPVVQICEKHRCGLICDFSSPESVAQAINRLLDDPDIYASMRAGALRAAQIYNWENQEQVLLDVYRRLLTDGTSQ